MKCFRKLLKAEITDNEITLKLSVAVLGNIMELVDEYLLSQYTNI